MTYYVKRNEVDNKTHLFDNAKCFCDNKEHFSYALVSTGLRKALTTCKLCLDRVGYFVRRDLYRVMRDM